MTGRELIVYILEHKLEDEDVLSKDGKLIGFMDEKEAAAKFKVGIETILVWHRLGYIEGYQLGTSIFIPKTVIDPRLNIINRQGE